ncbi:iron ABC transporter permease [Gracilibacillus oryzae]|uniref:Iron ABC transporter permease n=2 Tax=Gracilibacillus oryzae TaxID=1672701 RepID=A0A7C8GTJ5_9BACI|nr:iron ABC transporter permease [Gracilibacillus oryzae]
MHRYLSPNSISGWIVTIVLTILILVPLMAVLMQIFFPGLFFGDNQFAGWEILFQIFERKLWSVSLINSLTLATGTAILGTILGGALAILRSSRSFKTAVALDFAAWALLILPSFILAQGWILFASGKGIANQLFSVTWITDLVFQPFGLIMIMTLCKFSYTYLAVTAALEWNVKRYGEAARLCGASNWTTFWTIHTPLLIPAFLSGAALIFMDTIGDFGLPASLAAVYSFPTLPYSIYTALYTAPIRFDMAGVLSLYLVGIIFIAMLFQMWVLKKGKFDFMNERAERQVAKKSRYSFLYTLVNIGFLLIALGIPIGSNLLVSFMKTIGNGISIGNFTLEHYRILFQLDSTMLEGLSNSLLIAGIAAVIGMIIGFFIGYVLIFTNFRLSPLVDSLSIISLAVPGVVLGIGYIFVWNQPWLEPLGLQLYGTPWILILASVAGAIPIAARLMISSMTKIPQSLLSAAALQGASFKERILTILIPLIRASLLTAGLTAFGTSVFDLAVSTILFPPGFMTLPVAINQAFDDLEYGYATAATIFSGTFVVLVIMGLRWMIEKWFNRKQTSKGEMKEHVITGSEHIEEL